MKPPGVLKTLVGVVSEVRTANNLANSCKLLLPSLSHINGDNLASCSHVFPISDACILKSGLYIPSLMHTSSLAIATQDACIWTLTQEPGFFYRVFDIHVPCDSAQLSRSLERLGCTACP